MKKYQKQKLIEEKQNSKNIKGHNYKNNGIKTNNNLMKIKTRDNLKNTSSLNLNKTKVNTSNEIMKKSKLQNIKQNSSRLKTTVQKTGKVVANVAKKLYNGLKGIGMLIVSGGGIVLVILIIILLITRMFGSAFGFLFSNETPKTEESMSINSAIHSLNSEIDYEIEKIKDKTNYDSIRIENRNVVFKEILSIYSVITTNRETKFDITQMNEQNYEKLSEIFWNVVEVAYYTENYTVKVVTTDADGNKVTKTKTKIRLIINVKALSLEEMMELYDMNKSERKQVEEMMNGQFDEMWNVLDILEYLMCFRIPKYPFDTVCPMVFLM